MRSIRLRFVASLLTLTGVSFAGVGHAASLVVQYPLDGGDSYYSSIDAGQQNADDFTLLVDSTLDGLSWWGTSAGSGDGVFTVRLFAFDASGEAELSPFTTLTGSVARFDTAFVDSAGDQIHRYDMSGLPPGLGLSAGNYLMSVTSENTEFAWFWIAGGDGNGHSFFRGEDESAWDRYDGDFALELRGIQATPVPLPGAFGLLGAAVVLLGAFGRRRTPASA